MKFFLLFTLLPFFECAYSQQSVSELIAETRESNYQIDWKYKAGEYLIFDCERNHYACVNREGNDNCREERNFAMEQKSKSYPCASLKKFKNKTACVVKHYKIVDINAIKRFCYPK